MSLNIDVTQTKYPCVVCLERAKFPVTCLRCYKLVCQIHLQKIHDRCPHCRLTPFRYQRQSHLLGLIDLERNKLQDKAIESNIFKCLVQGCNFEGKYHKMDLHRRKEHKNETLRQIIFVEEKEMGRKQKAVKQMLEKIEQKRREDLYCYQTALVLYAKSNKLVAFNRLFEMVKHINRCGHPQCRKVYVQATMTFIGTPDKQISQCPVSQEYLFFN